MADIHNIKHDYL